MTRLPLALAAVLLAAATARAAEPARSIPLARGIVPWVAVTPDSKRLLVATNAPTGTGGELHLFDLATGKPVGAPAALDGLPTCGAVSPDGGRAVTGDVNGRWQAWDLPTLKPAGAGKLGVTRVHRLAFAPDGRHVAALAADYGRRIQDPRKENRVTYRASVLTPWDKEKVAGGPVVWPRLLGPGETAGDPRNTEPADWTTAAGPAFDAAGHPVPPQGEAARALAVPGDHERCGVGMGFAVSPDRKRAASLGCNGLLAVWEHPARKLAGEPFRVLGWPSLVGATFGPDGSRLAVLGRPTAESELAVVDVRTRAVVAGPFRVGLVPSGGPVFAPDGSVVVLPTTGTGTGAVEVWDLPVAK